MSPPWTHGAILSSHLTAWSSTPYNFPPSDEAKSALVRSFHRHIRKENYHSFDQVRPHRRRDALCRFGCCGNLPTHPAHHPFPSSGRCLLRPELEPALSLAPEQPSIRRIYQKLPGRPRTAAPSEDPDDPDFVAYDRLHRVICRIVLVGSTDLILDRGGGDTSFNYDQDIHLGPKSRAD